MNSLTPCLPLPKEKPRLKALGKSNKNPVKLAEMKQALDF